MRTWSTTVVIWLVMASIGCVEGFDSANGSDKAYYRLYDYTIDRPRILGISYWPLVFTGGDTVTFNALAATPGNLRDARVEWWGCGATLEVPFAYYGADCLFTSIAEYLGEGQTLSLTMPEYDTSSCADYGCYGYMPLFAVAYGEPGTEPELGYGMTWLVPDYLDQYSPILIESSLHTANISLRLNGFSGSTTARPGDTVDLEVRVASTDTDYQFSWYVSAGRLLDLGLTRATRVYLQESPQVSIVLSGNRLVIPKDFEGDRIEIYLVIDPVSYYYPGLERFATGTVEVAP